MPTEQISGPGPGHFWITIDDFPVRSVQKISLTHWRASRRLGVDVADHRIQLHIHLIQGSLHALDEDAAHPFGAQIPCLAADADADF